MSVWTCRGQGGELRTLGLLLSSTFVVYYVLTPYDTLAVPGRTAKAQGANCGGLGLALG